MCWAEEKAAGRRGHDRGPTSTFSPLEKGDWFISCERKGWAFGDLYVSTSLD